MPTNRTRQPERLVELIRDFLTSSGNDSLDDA